MNSNATIGSYKTTSLKEVFFKKNLKAKAFKRKHSLEKILYKSKKNLKEQNLNVKTFANKGDVAEGILGAAITAKFLYPERLVTTEDVHSIIEQLNLTSNLSQKATVIKRKDFTRKPNPEIPDSKEDTISLTIGLSKNNFAGLVDKNFLGKMSSIINGAIKFANHTHVSEASKQVFDDPKSNTVYVSSIGTEDQRGTKVDLTVSIDGKQISWGKLSLKAGGTKQLGQVGKGWAGNPEAKRFVRGITDLFSSLFNVQVDPDLKEMYVNALQSGSPEKVLNAIELVYENAYEKIEKKFEGDEKELMDFINSLIRGIKYEASLEEEGVVLVHLDSNDFVALNFDNLNKLGEEEDLEIQVELDTTGKVPYIYIYLLINDIDYGKLISIRPKIRFKDGRLHEFRHYVEKEHGLIKLISTTNQ